MPCREGGGAGLEETESWLNILQISNLLHESASRLRGLHRMSAPGNALGNCICRTIRLQLFAILHGAMATVTRSRTTAVVPTSAAFPRCAAVVRRVQCRIVMRCEDRSLNQDIPQGQIAEILGRSIFRDRCSCKISHPFTLMRDTRARL